LVLPLLQHDQTPHHPVEWMCTLLQE